MPIATEALRAFLTQGIKNALDQPIDETSNSDEVNQRQVAPPLKLELQLVKELVQYREQTVIIHRKE